MAHTFTRAIVRRPAPTLAAGLSTAGLGTPDPDLALQQFDRYVEALVICGLAVEILEPHPEFPDAHFVEDTAVVAGDVAVIARPGAAARRGEADLMEPALAAHRPIHRITAPGTLDGGDVLVAGNQAFIGLSSRTDADGAGQLGGVLQAHGLSCRTLPVDAGLHLKSSVNLVGDGVLLVTAAFALREELAGFDLLVAPEHEAYACNTLLVNDHLLVPAGFADTRQLLEPLGHEILELDTSEFRKMDGGLSCLSLRF